MKQEIKFYNNKELLATLKRIPTEDTKGTEIDRIKLHCELKNSTDVSNLINFLIATVPCFSK